MKLKVKDVVDLGGRKEDLELIKDIDSDEEEEIVVEYSEAEEIPTEEVENYVKKLTGDFKVSKDLKRSDPIHGKKQETVSVPSPQVSNEKRYNKASKFVSSDNDGQPLNNNKEKNSKKKKNKFKLQDNKVTSTVEVCMESVDLWNKHKQRTTMLIKPGSKWFEHNLTPDPTDYKPVNSELASNLEKFAQKLLEEDVALYKKYQNKRKEHSDFNWIKTVVNSGTLSDKIAAHTLLIQDSPVHNLTSMEILIKMISMKGKRECLMAMTALRDLFLSDLLLPDKKLKSFDQHPLSKLEVLSSGNYEARDRRLLLWYFESEVRRHYATFVHSLESVSHDTVEKMKQKTVTVMSELLTYNPEQEQFLLVNIVNKLGDPVHKIAAQVAHLLGKVVNHHPNMKEVVVKEVERLLFRPNITERAQYYTLCFLNQLILNQNDTTLAGRLIQIYFSFFKACVKKGEVDTKMMSALLTGVSRAYPYSRLQDDVLTEKLDTMYRIVHMVSFNVSVQALMLIFQVLDSKNNVSDRFYTSLYRKLLDPSLSHSSKQAMFLNLVYQALKKDISLKRIKSFVKRLVQVCHYQAPSLICGILYLISELTKKHPTLLDVKQHLLLDSDEEEHYQDAPEEDTPQTENSSLQIGSYSSDPKDNNTQTDFNKQLQPQYSWLHHANLNNRKNLKFVYDPFHRNPLYAGAEYCELWELYKLRNHYHPSVSLFAQKLLNKEAIVYNGDPLQDFTLSRFLDRFAYRNPKKAPAENASGHKRVFGRRHIYFPSGGRQIPVTSDSYLQQNENNIPVEELFLYRYFSQRTTKENKNDDSDIESVTSEDFDEYLQKKFNIGGEGGLVDFASDVASYQQKKKKKKDSSDEEENSQSISEDDDDDINFDSDEDFDKAFADFSDLEDSETKQVTFDEEAAEFSENDDFSSPPTRKRKSQKNKNMKIKKQKRFNTEGLFASAEEFSMLLEQNVGSKTDTTTSQALSNRDNADAKQLSWEMKRDHWLHGKNWRNKRKQKPYKKKMYSKKKNFSNKNAKKKM